MSRATALETRASSFQRVTSVGLHADKQYTVMVSDPFEGLLITCNAVHESPPASRETQSDAP